MVLVMLFSIYFLSFYIAEAVMGGLFSSSKKCEPNKAVTEHDRATLSLKLQRDKMKQTCKRYEVNIDKDKERARTLIRDGKKERALLLLRRKHYQESMVGRVSGYLAQIERMITDLEMAQINQDVYDKLRLGNKALKTLNEAISLDEVERIMEETREAHAFQEELSAILSQNLSEEDNELAEEEFEKMLSEQLPEAPNQPLTIETPIHEKKKSDGEKEPKRRREAVALEA